MTWLAGKVALITGAGEGIGKAVATRYLEEGATGIVAVDIAEDRLAALKDNLGDRVVTMRGDVRSIADNRNAVALAVEQFGKLDIFVGNAGVRDARRRLDDATDTELSDGFDEVFAINVKGYLLGAMAAREELARNRGCIVYTLSTSSYYIGGGSIYIASNHAALGLTRSLAHELAPDIRVNGDDGPLNLTTADDVVVFAAATVQHQTHAALGRSGVEASVWASGVGTGVGSGLLSVGGRRIGTVRTGIDGRGGIV